MPQEFIIGQRWISDTELELGLGIVAGHDHRTVSILFLSTGETRTYAKHSAPLTRVQFRAGDVIKSREGWPLHVESVQNENGLLVYNGTKDDDTVATLKESELDHRIRLNRPADRIFSGQFDTNTWFNLRNETHEYISAMLRSDLRGLTGGRTSLIPHQLYIAHEVARRFAPRVLLADEVGLGKTIEAGMIVHQQLVSGLAERVLVVVPETLVHQWLVEMMRRFNLRFSIFDEDRCEAMEENLTETELQQYNPFLSEQLVLCSLGFLMKNARHAHQAMSGEWDLLVVDEAHHLQWSPETPGKEYELVNQIAQNTPGVLLLTATPEQLGRESHYARLRLLDPDRFPSLESFLAEEKHYTPIADAIDELIRGITPGKESLLLLASTLEEGDNRKYLETLQDTSATQAQTEHARTRLIEHLLDRHGTGRVLFRNTRNSIQGFPPRKLVSNPLETPEAYSPAVNREHVSIDLEICPESLYESNRTPGMPEWTQLDPRIEWLAKTLQSLKPEKVLVIAAQSETVLQLSATLLEKYGIHAAVFHERLSIIERDRAAAYFADRETGTQILICSEIGSEGRNFQFAHHLVLFDLPLNPDLLEQRIGRLDRIGQTKTIRIHVPYLVSSAQEILFHWYHGGLNAFEHTCPAASNVYSQVKDLLLDAISRHDSEPSSLDALVDTTRQLNEKLNRQLQEGRDRLLEYNSCRPIQADQLYQRALQADRENKLQSYLVSLFDCLGLEIEDHSHDCYIIRPSEATQEGFFPGLRDDGLTYTCDRATALTHENFQFFTWDHPMVSNAMEAIVNSEKGNTTICAVKNTGIKPGTLLVETLYVLETASSRKHPANRYLPSSTIHLLHDILGNRHENLASDFLRNHCQLVDPAVGRKVIKAYDDKIKDTLATSEKIANETGSAILKQAHLDMERSMQQEIDRLKALSHYNPNIRAEEITYFEEQKTALGTMLENAGVRLDAIRLLITL